MDFLNYTDWQDTADTLHMLLQMSGKVKLLYRAKRPEWAHIRQYLTLDGISTGIVPEAPVPLKLISISAKIRWSSGITTEKPKRWPWRTGRVSETITGSLWRH